MLFQININEIACVIETTVTVKELPLRIGDRVRKFANLPDEEVVRRVEVIFKSGRQIELTGDQVDILERKFKECGEL